MLSWCKGLSPAAIESHQDKHQALGVKGRPTQEEGKNHNNWNKYIFITFPNDSSYQACGWQSSFPGCRSLKKTRCKMIWCIINRLQSYIFWTMYTNLSASVCPSLQDAAHLFILSLCSVRPILEKDINKWKGQSDKSRVERCLSKDIQVCFYRITIWDKIKIQTFLIFIYIAMLNFGTFLFLP